MHLAHNILITVLALIFLIAGVSKLGGSPKGLSGTRDLHVPDFLARLVGLFEAVASLLLIYSLRYPDTFLAWFALSFLWCGMGVSIFLHSRQNKMSSAFPPFFLITLLSIALVIF